LKSLISSTIKVAWVTVRPVVMGGVAGAGIGSGCSELKLPLSEELESEGADDELEDSGERRPGWAVGRVKLKFGPFPSGRILDR
jgi:hypothetical protein